MRIGRLPALLLVLLGIATRLAFTFTSVGTNDVGSWLLWRSLAQQYGFAGAAQRAPVVIHPPLAIAAIEMIGKASDAMHLPLYTGIRIVQTIADGVLFLLLLAIAKKEQCNTEPLLLYFLAPPAIFISGFHCNTDPTLLALIASAVFLAYGGAASVFAAGVCLALSCGVKTVPVLLLPFFIARLGKRVAPFVAGFALTFAAAFAPVFLARDRGVFDKVFGYSGFAGKFGPTAILLTTGRIWSGAQQTLYDVAVGYARHGKIFLLAFVAALGLHAWLRKRGDSRALLQSIALVFLGALLIGPGYGIQYLLWPLPFLPYLVGRRITTGYVVVTTAYMFLTYTVWAGGWPWWYANSLAERPLKPLIVWAGIPVWLIVAAMTVHAIRRVWRSPVEQSASETA